MHPKTAQPLLRILGVATGIAAFAAGGFLLIRPLTSIVVLGGVLLLAVALGAILSARRALARPWWWTVVLLAVIVIVIGAFLFGELLALLPVIVSAALVVWAARKAYLATRRTSASNRVTRILWAAVMVGSAAIALLWPDLTTVLLGLVTALALLVAGSVLVWRSLRRAPGRTRSRQHPLLRLVASAVACVVVAAALTGTVMLTAGTPVADDFYALPADGVPKVAGTIVRVEPYAGEVPEGASAQRILYATTNEDDVPVLASAVVAIPTSAGTDRTILAWQHGTTGVAQSCAPSLTDIALTEYAIPGISRAIDRDWIVVATDYPGQGTAGPYPYLVGVGEGRATLDAVRAVQNLADAHASDRVMLWGHSQGGHATLWAGQIAADYAPELQVESVAALSAAWDPLSLAERITGAQGSALGDIITSYVLVPYAQAYSDISLSADVHPAGVPLVKGYAGRCVTSGAMVVSLITALAVSADAPLYDIDLKGGPTRTRLQDNVASGIVDAPLFLGQGDADEVIPIEMQRSLAHKLCADGRNVVVHEYPGATHMGVIAEGSPLIDDLYSWVDAIGAGEAPAATCS